jgi:LuxR family maltose regulon positive regulatory protein
MDRTPTLAKLAPPSLPKIVERSRLFRLLKPSRHQPVIWIVAPPGYGKTTLVASYLRTQRLRTLWYQVDESDADLPTFFHYFALAARAKRPLPKLTPEHLPTILIFARKFFRALCESFKQPTALVLDNYQQVPVAHLFHDVIDVALAEIPSHVTVYIMSREGPPPALVRLQAGRSVKVIDAEALRLTAREANEIVRLYGKTHRWNPSPTLAQGLMLQAGGWSAGLVLLLERARADKANAHLEGHQSLEETFAYLAREVFKHLNAESQSVLLRSAFFPNMTGEMVDELSESHEAEAVLAALHKGGYFTERRQEHPVRYQFHPLFQEFLVTRARQLLSQEQLVAIQSRSAQILERDGQLETVVAIYSNIGQFEEITRIVLTQGPALLMQGRVTTLEKWLRVLPQQFLEEVPWLSYWNCVCLFHRNPELAYDMYGRTFEKFASVQDAFGMVLAWCGVVEAVAYSYGKLLRLDEWLDQFPATVDLSERPLPQSLKARIAWARTAALAWRRPEDPQMDYWLQEAQEQVVQLSDPSQQVVLGGFLMNILKWKGHLVQVEVLWRHLNQVYRRGNLSGLGHVVYWMTQAEYRSMKNEWDLCAEAARAGLRAVEEHGLVHLPTMGYLRWYGLHASCCTADLETAHRFLREMQTDMEVDCHLAGALYHYGASMLSAAEGKVQQALFEAERAVRLTVENGVLMSEVLCRIALVHLLLEAGRPQDASPHMARVREIDAAIGTSYLTFFARLAEAHYAFEAGDRAAGLAELRTAMTLSREREFITLPWLHHKIMTDLCVTALEEDIETEHVRALIRMWRLKADPMRVTIAGWPWTVRCHTLGRFVVDLDGRPLTFQRKSKRKVLDLLKAIIAFGGRDVPVGKLTDALWPEADGDAANRVFDTTLHRLRKLIEHDTAIELRNNRVRLVPQYCYLDMQVFERCLDDAERKDESTEAAERLRLLERGLQCYTGYFLDGEEEVTWIEPARERLHRRFLHATVDSARLSHAQGETGRAIGRLTYGIEVDPGASELYVLLLKLLATADRKSEAIQWYERFRSTLAHTPQTRIPPDLEAAYRALKPQ